MVKPPLRTKSIGFKVSEEEYAQLETAAQASGRTLGEWCREVILRGGSASDDPALAEIIGVRLLLVNVLRPLAAGEKLAPEAFDKMLDQISEVKHELAAKLQQQAAEETAAAKTQRRREWVISNFFAGECTERGRPVKALRFASMNAQKTRGLDSPPSPLLCCFQLGKNVIEKWKSGRSGISGRLRGGVLRR